MANESGGSIVYMSNFGIIERICLIVGGLTFINKGLPRVFNRDQDLLDLWGDTCEYLGNKAHGVFSTGVRVIGAFNGNSQN